MLKFIIFLSYFSSSLLNAQNFAFVKESKLLAAAPKYNITKKSLDSLKLVLEQESKALQEVNRIQILDLVKQNKVEEEPLLENLYQVLKKVDTKAYEKLLNEQEQLFHSIKAKELIYHKAYENQMVPIIKRINQIVQDYCKSRGISVLYKLDQIESNMAYLDTKLDITEELINYLNGTK